MTMPMTRTSSRKHSKTGTITCTPKMYRKRFRQVKPENEEMPDQFFILLKLPSQVVEPGSSPGDFDALVDLIVKEQLSTLVLKNWSCIC